MADFGPDIAADVAAACQQNAEAVVAAFGKLSESQFVLTPGEAAPAGAVEFPATEGLLFLFEVGQQAAALVLPQGCGLLPDWMTKPDAAQLQQLDELASEVGKLLLPPKFAPARSEAIVAKDLTAAIQQGQPGPQAVRLALSTQVSDAEPCELSLLWPLEKAANLRPAEDESAKVVVDDDSGADATTSFHAIENLPNYARSLLKVRVPVVAVLARRKQSVADTLALGPGSIIQFDKSCEQLLELQAGEQPFALGEAVKVGDKFGLRIREVMLPDERFKKVS